MVEGKLAELKAEVGTQGAPTDYKKGKLVACTSTLLFACFRCVVPLLVARCCSPASVSSRCWLYASARLFPLCHPAVWLRLLVVLARR